MPLSSLMYSNPEAGMRMSSESCTVAIVNFPRSLYIWRAPMNHGTYVRTRSTSTYALRVFRAFTAASSGTPFACAALSALLSC